jgi:hypothetical protein
MKKTNKMICGILIATMILFAGISNAQAAEVPKWVPKDTDVKDYNLFWSDTFTFKSLNFEGEEKNETYHSQLWYKNNSDNKVVALIGIGMVELAEDYLSEKLSDSFKNSILVPAKYKECETKWDLIATAMGGETEDVEGFDRAIMFGSGGNYILFGTVGKIMVLSVGLDTENWLSGFEFIALVLYAAILAVIIAVTLALFFVDLIFGTAAAVPTAEETSTSKEDVVDFNSQIGKSLKMAQIDGYSFMIVFAVSMVSAALLIKKRYLKKIE